jgi:hypothetical protein
MTICQLSRLVWVTLLFPLVAVANPNERASTVAPFIDELTIAMAYVDFAKVDGDATLAWLGTLTPDKRLAARITNARESWKAIGPLMQKAGVEAYIVLSLADIPNPGPFLVARVKPGSDRQAIVDVLSKLPAETCEVVGEMVFSGPKSVLQRLKTMKPTSRPQLAQAFAAAGDAPFQLLLVPSADQRRVIAEMLPQLPAETGGGSGKAIADMEWSAIAVSPPPNVSIHLTAQSASAESARALQNTLATFYRVASRMESVRSNLANVGDLAAIATPRIEGNRLSLRVTDADGKLRQLLSPASKPLTEALGQANRAQCTNNLKQLALAMHNYHDQHGQFPMAASLDPSGKPLLSWRVLLLPYLDQQSLYEQFHLDEPWDSEHNRALSAKMPAVFACAETGLLKEGKTTYAVPVGKNALFRGKKGMRFQDIRDGTSNTIMIVEIAAANAVVWTKPEDVEIDPKNPGLHLKSEHGNEFATSFCDGSVQWIRSDIAPSTLRLLFDPSDGNVIPAY